MPDIGIRVVVQGVAEARRNVGAVQTDINGLEKTIEKVSGTSSSLGKTLTSVGSAMVGLGRTLSIAVTAPIAAAGAALLEAGISFEHAFSGVTKTVDGLAESTGELTDAGVALRDQFVELSTTIPVSADQLAALGQLSGQFGQSKETVLDMVKVLAMLRESTDLTSDTQQMAFAQVAEIAGVTADKFDNMASALVYLGNNFPTTESRIISFTERIVGTATALGISIDQIIGWGGAVTASGIQAETGATALRKAFMEMSLAATTAASGMVDVSEEAAAASDKIDRLTQRIAVANQRQSEFTDKTRESTRMANQFSLENMNEDLQEQTDLLAGLEQIQGKVFQGGSDKLQEFARVSSLAFSESGMSVEAFAAKFGILPDLLKDGSLSATEFSDIFANNASAALDLFINGLNKMSAMDQIEALKMLGLSAQRVGSTLQNLAVNADMVDEALAGVADAYAEGTALQEEFNKRTATVQASLQTLKNQFTALGIEVFNLVRDDLKGLIESIGDVVDKFMQLSPETQKTIMLIAGVAAAIGPLLILIGGAVAALGTLVTAFTALISGPALAAAAVLAFVAALGSIYVPPLLQDFMQQWNTMDLSGISLPEISQPTMAPGSIQQAQAMSSAESRGVAPGSLQEIQNIASAPPPTEPLTAFGAVMESVSKKAQEMWAAIQEFTQSEGFVNFLNTANATLQFLGTMIVQVATAVGQTLGPVFQEVFASLTELLASFGLDWGDVWNAVKQAVVIVATVIGAILLGLVGIIVGIVTAISRGIESLANTITNVKEGIQQTFEGLIEFFAGAWMAIQGLFTGNEDMVKAGLTAMGQGILDIISGVGTTLVSLWGGFIDLIVSLVSGFVEGTLGFFGNLWEGLTGQSADGVQGIIDWFANLRERTTEIVNNLVTGIQGFFANLKTMVPEAVAAMVAAVVLIFNDLYMQLVGGSIVPDMVNGIINSFTNLKDTVVKLASDLVTGALGFFTDLATKAGDILKNLFSGSGTTTAFDSTQIDAVSSAVDTLKGKLTETQGTLSTLAGAFTTVLTGPATTAFTAMTTAMAAQWLMVTTAFQAQTQAVANALMLTYATIGMSFTTTMVMMTVALTQFVVNASASLGTIGAVLSEVENKVKEMSEQTQTSMMEARGAVQWLSAMFYNLAAAAEEAASRIENANQRIVDSNNRTVQESVGSPYLKIQGLFMKLEDYLKNTDFAFAMDMSANEVGMSGLLSALMPASTVSTTNVANDNSVVVNGASIQNDRSLANMIYQRQQARAG